MKHAIRSIAAGSARVLRCPKLLLGLWLLNVAAALPAALVMSEILAESIGPSLFHRSLEEGFDSDWYAELSAETDGLAETFGPRLIGIAAVYENLEAWWSGRLVGEPPIALVALGVAYALVWAMLMGGVLDVLSRSPSAAGPKGLAGFLSAGARTFGRFLQLVIGAAVVYYLVYRLAAKIYGWIEDATRDVTSETAILVRVLVVAAATVLVLHLVRMIFDYAKIAVFAEDLSAPRALVRALRFVASRPFRAAAVYLGFAAAVLLIIVLYSWVAPGAGQSSFAAVLFAFLVSQVYLLARLAARLALLGAELHLFRSS